MGRWSLCFSLFSVTFILLDFTSATKQEDVYRLKRSPQMPQMPQPPSPPDGFPSPPSMPFRRVVRHLSEGPPAEFSSANNDHSVYPQFRAQRHMQGMNSRSKREARGTGGKFPNRGG